LRRSGLREISDLRLSSLNVTTFEANVTTFNADDGSPMPDEM